VGNLRPRIASQPDAQHAWRIGRRHSEGARDQEAHEAAVAAVQSVLSLAWKEASVDAVNAVT
jgi:hypothetical protein